MMTGIQKEAKVTVLFVFENSNPPSLNLFSFEPCSKSVQEILCDIYHSKVGKSDWVFFGCFLKCIENFSRRFDK